MRGLRLLLIFIVVVVIGIIAYVYPVMEPTGQILQTSSNMVSGSCGYAGEGIRPQYFDCETQKEMFSLLPLISDDFFSTRNLFVYRFVTFEGKILDESYWKQPEWFPNYDKPGGPLDSIKNYIKQAEQSGKWGVTVWCAGIYPSDFYAKTKQGRELTLYTWIRNSPHQSKYEGVSLKTVYPGCDSFVGMEFDLGNKTVCQDPDYVKEHVRFTITPDEFLLGPSFPVYSPSHTEMIRIDVDIADDIEPGRYVIGFDAGLPSEEFNQKYYLEYGFDYTGSPREFHCAPGPQYRLFLDIE